MTPRPVPCARVLPGRVDGDRRVLSAEEYLRCILTAFCAAPSDSDEEDLTCSALGTACRRLGFLVGDVAEAPMLRPAAPGDDASDLLALAWLAAPRGTDEEASIREALELASARAGRGIVTTAWSLPLPHRVEVAS